MRGLMMGRFQPFHLGHLDLVKQILKECDEVIILVTSSQFNYLEKDPFTAGERLEMIHNSIKESDVDLTRCIILAIENQFNIATWSAYLKSMLPHFDRVYSGNDYVKMLLADSNIEVIKPVFLDRGQYNATKIRSMIISEENWEEFVPKAVVDFIKKINGKTRLKTIHKSDTKPTEH
ncbi:MAG: nicotinamide-nucleotide adenylyltransferase [Nitrosopumilaceae archaeon]|nr:nicotinamide-nucleotide adenylyltransferase [Nitrosopumilaceae archaeon]NIP10572.1 nicotinamide-nucleotide adenylyltransferase [Nitrosopumilaceae archaeon]NIS94895.1 nicotinamide-nucleotide adenylyltransferase [Nitrosopumilaceae archaeon]